MPATIDQWTVVVGVLMPLLIAAINRTAWSSGQKSVGALVICIAAAAGELTVKGQFDVKHLGANALAVFFMTVTTYYGFWKPTGIAPALEQKTG
jgi:hypothetical protein